MNRRIRNRTYGGVGGRGPRGPSYPILQTPLDSPSLALSICREQTNIIVSNQPQRLKRTKEAIHAAGRKSD